MHSSWGNTIDAPDAFARMGADVMRWQFCAQPPDRNLLFGFGPAHEIQRRLLTLWNSVTFLVQYANVGGVHAALRRPRRRGGRPRSRSTAGSSSARGSSSRRRPDAYERWLTVDVIRAFEAFVDDLSNWYIRRSRRRFWEGDEVGASRALARARPVAARDRAGDAVPRRAPLAGARARAVRGRARLGASSPAGPAAAAPDAAALAAMADARRIVDLGRAARSTSGVKLRQPLARLVVEGAAPAGDARRDRARRAAREGRRARPRRGRARREAEPAACSGRSSGQELGAVRAALAAGEFEDLGGRPLPRGRARARARRGARRALRRGRAGRSPRPTASPSRSTRRVDEELAREARVYELIHRVNTMRKEAGLALTDRIALTIPASRRRPARARGLDQGRDARDLARDRRRGRRAIAKA